MSESDEIDAVRQMIDRVATPLDSEPDYGWNETFRHEMELLYMRVHNLPAVCARALVTADDHERYAIKNDVLTDEVKTAVARTRRAAWARSDEETMLPLITESTDAVRAAKVSSHRNEGER